MYSPSVSRNTVSPAAGCCGVRPHLMAAEDLLKKKRKIAQPSDHIKHTITVHDNSRRNPIRCFGCISERP